MVSTFSHAHRCCSSALRYARVLSPLDPAGFWGRGSWRYTQHQVAGPGLHISPLLWSNWRSPAVRHASSIATLFGLPAAESAFSAQRRIMVVLLNFAWPPSINAFAYFLRDPTFESLSTAGVSETVASCGLDAAFEIGNLGGARRTASGFDGEPCISACRGLCRLACRLRRIAALTYIVSRIRGRLKACGTETRKNAPAMEKCYLRRTQALPCLGRSVLADQNLDGTPRRRVTHGRGNSASVVTCDPSSRIWNRRAVRRRGA